MAETKLAGRSAANRPGFEGSGFRHTHTCFLLTPTAAMMALETASLDARAVGRVLARNFGLHHVGDLLGTGVVPPARTLPQHMRAEVRPAAWPQLRWSSPSRSPSHSHPRSQRRASACATNVRRGDHARPGP